MPLNSEGMKGKDSLWDWIPLLTYQVIGILALSDLDTGEAGMPGLISVTGKMAAI